MGRGLKWTPHFQDPETLVACTQLEEVRSLEATATHLHGLMSNSRQSRVLAWGLFLSRVTSEAGGSLRVTPQTLGVLVRYEGTLDFSFVVGSPTSAPTESPARTGLRVFLALGSRSKNAAERVARDLPDRWRIRPATSATGSPGFCVAARLGKNGSMDHLIADLRSAGTVDLLEEDQCRLVLQLTVDSDRGGLTVPQPLLDAVASLAGWLEFRFMRVPVVSVA